MCIVASAGHLVQTLPKRDVGSIHLDVKRRKLVQCANSGVAEVVGEQGKLGFPLAGQRLPTADSVGCGFPSLGCPRGVSDEAEFNGRPLIEEPKEMATTKKSPGKKTTKKTAKRSPKAKPAKKTARKTAKRSPKAKSVKKAS